MSRRGRLILAAGVFALIGLVLSLTVCRTVPQQPAGQPQASRELVIARSMAGWSFGYCAKIENSGTITWIADTLKGERRVKVTGSSLMAAL